MDLRTFAAGERHDACDDEAGRRLHAAGGGRGRRSRSSARPTPARVAGGFELLLGCDVVVASPRRTFGLPEVKRGLFAGGGGMHVGKRLPLGVALELALTGDTIDADRAYELGLVNAVVAPDQVLATALGFAERIAANGPLGLAATKELVRLAAYGRARGPAAPAPSGSATVFASEDAKEGRDRVRREARAGVEGSRPDRAGCEAAVCHEYGPPEVVRVEEVRRSPLGPGQVRVPCTGRAVNFPDVLIVANEYQINVPTPFVPGSEFAGVVEEVGRRGRPASPWANG